MDTQTGQHHEKPWRSFGRNGEQMSMLKSLKHLIKINDSRYTGRVKNPLILMNILRVFLNTPISNKGYFALGTFITLVHLIEMMLDLTLIDEFFEHSLQVGENGA
jgi:hypothetical protein